MPKTVCPFCAGPLHDHDVSRQVDGKRFHIDCVIRKLKDDLNAARWDGVEPIPEDGPEFFIQQAVLDLRKRLAAVRGKHGRDFIRKLPQGKLLDALDAGRETGFIDDRS